MAKMCILTAMLLQLLFMLVQGQESPCPEYFTYVTKPGTYETMGQIEIRSPPKVGELHLKVTVKVAAELPNQYGGELKLAQSENDSAQAVLRGRSLLYHIYFPLRQPIPILFEIWFNGAKYCTGPEVKGSFVTTITLDHFLYLPNMLSYSPESHQVSTLPPKPSTPKKSTVSLSQGIGKNMFLNVVPGRDLPYDNVYLKPILDTTTVRQHVYLRPSQSSTKPVPQYDINNDSDRLVWPTTAKPRHINDNNNECGITSSSRFGNTNLLMADGQKTMPGQWPWLVALFVIKNNEYMFQCGGTILSTRHVLTAAHCLKESFYNNKTIHPNVLEVALGRFNLFWFREEGTINREIASYNIHHEYAHETTSDSDLAILILRTPVEYSHFIKPICLWTGSSDLQNVISRIGYVVGWGKDEYGHRYTDEPRMAIMPIVSLENCHWSNPGFVNLTSNRTFCAGLRDGSGPCNGDSGSGLVLYDNTTNRYRLRGVVSRSLRGNGPLCDLTKFIVFVDVAKYLSWIQEQISTT